MNQKYIVREVTEYEVEVEHPDDDGPTDIDIEQFIMDIFNSDPDAVRMVNVVDQRLIGKAVA